MVGTDRSRQTGIHEVQDVQGGGRTPNARQVDEAGLTGPAILIANNDDAVKC